MRELAEEMVTYRNGIIEIRSPVNPTSGRSHVAALAGSEKSASMLREVLVDLTEAMRDEVNESLNPRSRALGVTDRHMRLIAEKLRLIVRMSRPRREAA